MAPHETPNVIPLPPRTAPFHWLEGKEGFVWLLCAGLLLLTGVLKSINLVIVLAYVLVALWGLNLLLAKWPIVGLTAKRGPLPTIVAMQPVEWSLEVLHPDARQGYWTLEEHADDANQMWLVPPNTPSVHARMHAKFSKRGRHTLAPLLASSGYPFGLCRRSVELLPAGEFIVLAQPARIDVALLQAWLIRKHEGRDEDRRRARRLVEHEADLHGLRDYRAGDALRRIHWRSTARRGKLTVREYEDALPPRLVLVVDLWLPADADSNALTRVEQTVSLAAGIVAEWRRESGARLALLVCAQEPFIIDGLPGQSGTQHMLEALALTKGTHQSDVTPLLQQLTRPNLLAPMLVISTRDNSPVASVVSQFAKRPIGITYIGQLEPWFRLP